MLGKNPVTCLCDLGARNPKFPLRLLSDGQLRDVPTELGNRTRSKLVTLRPEVGTLREALGMRPLRTGVLVTVMSSYDTTQGMASRNSIEFK